jgi:D-beta-D-heptose 7-phosphate kinase/D-beta-D-heptose 1-phosphate adenosyltransferase
MPNIDSKTLDGLLDAVEKLRIAVIGDVMLDRFILGRVDRISPEAPVPVVHVRGEEERLGGAANVAANLRGLNMQVDLFGAIGPGEHGRAIVAAAAKLGIGTTGIIDCAGRESSVKTRILAGSQQVVRIDRESSDALADGDRQRLLSCLEEQN